jgi:hypothetical protein
MAFLSNATGRDRRSGGPTNASMAGWDAPYFVAISKYLGVTSYDRWESREWTGEEGKDVVSRFRRKEIADYLRKNNKID